MIISADPTAFNNLTADEIGLQNPQVVAAVDEHIRRGHYFRLNARGSPFVSTTTSLTWVISK